MSCDVDVDVDVDRVSYSFLLFRSKYLKPPAKNRNQPQDQPTKFDPKSIIPLYAIGYVFAFVVYASIDLMSTR